MGLHNVFLCFSAAHKKLLESVEEFARNLGRLAEIKAKKSGVENLCLGISPSAIVNQLHTLRRREFSREWQLWRARAASVFICVSGIRAWVRTSRVSGDGNGTEKLQHPESGAKLSFTFSLANAETRGGWAALVCIDCDDVTSQWLLSASFSSPCDTEGPKKRL